LVVRIKWKIEESYEEQEDLEATIILLPFVRMRTAQKLRSQQFVAAEMCLESSRLPTIGVNIHTLTDM
jgi:hypothetical protein